MKRLKLRIRNFGIIALLIVGGLVLSMGQADAAGLLRPSNNLGLQGFWSFEDGVGAKATDFSGNGNTGTLVNMSDSNWVAGKRGKAVKISTPPSDYNDYIDVANTINLNSAGGISLWFRGDELSSTNSVLVSSQNWDTSRDGVVITARDNVGLYWELDSSSASQAFTQGATMESDRWYHVVLTWNGSTVVTYLDGVQVDSQAQTVTPDTTVRPFRFGENAAGGSRALVGNLDEIRMYNRLLSATEVAALYGAGIAKTKAANNLGLVGYWSMEDGVGTKATDFSGNGNTGILNGATWVSGKRGKALSFTVNDYVTVPHNVNFKSNTQAISFWLYPTTLPAPQYDGVVSIYTSDSDSLECFISQSSYTLSCGNWPWTLEYTLPSANTWYHVYFEVVSNGTSGPGKLYVNGALVDGSGTVSYTGASNTATLEIGGRSSGAYDFPGFIDEVRVYNRVLTEAEIAALYGTSAARVRPPNNLGLVGYWSMEDGSGTKATDFSGTGNTGTLDDNPSWVSGKQGRALSFDGTGDSIDIAYNSSLDLTGDLTISSWIKVAAFVDTGGNGQRIVSHWNTQQYLVALMDDGQLRFAARGPGYTNQGLVESLLSITLNTWHHMTAVKSGTVISLYIDGQFMNSQDIGITTLNSAAEGVRIGEENSGGYNFNGQIDETRIYNRALSAIEINQLYRSAAAGGQVVMQGPYEPWRYVRWQISKRKASQDSLQASEFVPLLDGSTVSWPVGTTATNPGGSNPVGETPAQAIDGSLATKWLDFNFYGGAGPAEVGLSTLVIDTGSGNSIVFNGYKWGTANDSIPRDPLTWTVSGSNDGANWTVLDVKANEYVTDTRSTYTGNYSF